MRGSLSSRDGFVRNTDPDSVSYGYDHLYRADGALKKRGSIVYESSASIVSFRDFITDETEKEYFFVYSNGNRVTKFIRLDDGVPCCPDASATVFSKTKGCAELLIEALPCWFEGDFSSLPPETGLVFTSADSVKTVLPQGFTFTEK